MTEGNLGLGGKLVKREREKDLMLIHANGDVVVVSGYLWIDVRRNFTAHNITVNYANVNYVHYFEPLETLYKLTE